MTALQEIESNDSFELAQYVGQPSQETKILGMLSVDAPGSRTKVPESDYFRFTVDAPGNFEFSSSLNREIVSPTISLFDTSKTLLSSKTFVAPGLGTMQHELATGDYYLLLTAPKNYSNRGNSAVSEVVIKRLSTNSGGSTGRTELEPNGSFPSANNLGVLNNTLETEGILEVVKGSGNSRVGTLSRTPGSDYFRFTVETSGLYRGSIQFDRLAHSPIARLFRSDGGLIEAVSIESSSSAAMEGPLSPGDYFVEITGTPNTSGSNVEPGYVLRLNKLSDTQTPSKDQEPNDTPATAIHLGVLTDEVRVQGTLEVHRSSGNSRVGLLSRTPGSDYYQFDVNFPIDIEIFANVDRIQHQPTIRLLNKATGELMQSGEVKDSEGVQFIRRLPIGTYLVEVAGRSNTTGSDVAPKYSLTLRPLAATSLDTVAERESNDSFDSAQDLGYLPIGAEIRGEISIEKGPANDNDPLLRIPNADFFALRIGSPGSTAPVALRLILALDHVAHWPSITLYDSSRAPILTGTVDERGNSELLGQFPPGEYYLGMEAPRNRSGQDIAPKYRLSVEASSTTDQFDIDRSEIEPNDLLRTANRIGLIQSRREIRGKIDVEIGPGNSPIGKRERIPNADTFEFLLDETTEIAIGLELDRVHHSPKIELFNASSELLWQREFVEANRLTFHGELPAGVYRIRISAASNNSGSSVEPNYLLTLQPKPESESNGVPITGLEAEPNNWFASANQIGVLDDFTTVQGKLEVQRSAGNSHAAEVLYLVDPDFYSFELAAPSNIDLAVQFDRLPFLIRISLYDNSGNLVRDLELDSGLNLRSTINLSGGKYFLAITGSNALTGIRFSPSYLMSLQLDKAPSPDTTEPLNNGLDTAPLLSPNTALSNLSIAGTSDVDYFRLEVTSDLTNESAVQIAHAVGVDLDLELLNSQGQVIRSSRTSEPIEGIALAGLHRGTYFARVYGRTTRTGSYEIAYVSPSGEPGAVDHLEPNDSLLRASELNAIEGLKEVDSLSIHTNLVGVESVPDSDYFSFTILSNATESHYIRVVTTDYLKPSIAIFGASGTLLREGNEARISLAGLPAGEYVLAVSSKENTGFGYSLQWMTPVRPSGFHIQYQIDGDFVPSDLERQFQRALSRIESIVRGDLPDIEMDPNLNELEDAIADAFGARFDLPDGKIIDDLFVSVRIDAVDGPGDVLAWAAPIDARPDGRATMGIVQIDIDDYVEMLSSNTMIDTLVHEIFHILSVPELWGDEGHIRFDANGQIGFAAKNSLQQYRILSRNPQAATVPLEAGHSSRRPWGGHWNEAVFGNELMTPESNLASREPLSRLSIAMLDDLGYEVDYSKADDYSLPLPDVDDGWFDDGGYLDSHSNTKGLINDISFGRRLNSRLIAPELSTLQPRRNSIQSTDVDGSGNTDPLDVLNLINEINKGGRGIDTDLSLDVDGDLVLSPIDVLSIVNVLNKPRFTPRSGSGGEGEAPDDELPLAFPEAAGSSDFSSSSHDPQAALVFANPAWIMDILEEDNRFQRRASRWQGRLL